MLMKKIACRLMSLSCLTVAVALAGCSIQFPQSGVRHLFNFERRNRSYLEVAPVFENGIGKAFTDDSRGIPSICLTEEEAFEVISLEAQGAGINFIQNALELSGLRLPDLLENQRIMPGKNAESFTLDGYDAENKVGFEFVSQEDMNNWSLKSTSPDKFSELADTLALAYSLSEGLGDVEGKGTVAAFYEPEVNYSEEEYLLLKKTCQNDPEALAHKLKEIEKEYLRMQVRDFLNWLGDSSPSG